MARRIFKPGNSLVVSLPRASLELLGLQESSQELKQFTLEAGNEELDLGGFAEWLEHYSVQVEE